MTRRGLMTTVLIMGACLVPEHSHAATPAAKPAGVVAMLPPVGPFPDAVCDEDNSPGIYIGPDGILWDCVCEKIGDTIACDWYEQGMATRQRNAKLVRKAKLRLRITRLPRLVVIRLGN